MKSKPLQERYACEQQVSFCYAPSKVLFVLACLIVMLGCTDCQNEAPA